MLACDPRLGQVRVRGCSMRDITVDMLSRGIAVGKVPRVGASQEPRKEESGIGSWCRR
jgi:hypothetical protein